MKIGASPHRRRALTASLVLLLGAWLPVAACNSSSTAPTPTPPRAEYSQTDLQMGDGKAASPGLVAVVDYNGYFYVPGTADPRGQLFDSSAQSGPISFVLGAGQVIPGFEQGVVGMREGGIRRLIVPPELAYGSTGSGPIPPNTTLVFDVLLREVRDPS